MRLDCPFSPGGAWFGDPSSRIERFDTGVRLRLRRGASLATPPNKASKILLGLAGALRHSAL